MNSLTRIGYLSVICLIFLFSSCENDEVTSISLNKQNLTMKVGQSDSVNVVVQFTGDISKQPVTLSVADSKVASAALSVIQDETKTTGTSFTKNIIISAISTGSTTVNIQIGTKTTSIPVNITQTSIVFNHISVQNYGPVFYDLYDISNNYLSVEITSGTAAFNSITKKYSGTGKILIMNIMTPLSINNIAQGDYSAANNAEANTFFPGSDDGTYYYPAFIIDLVNGEKTIQIISDGTFSVSQNSDETFTIEGNLNSDTDGIVHFSYNGIIIPDDKQMKNQTPLFTSGSLDYYADLFYESGLSNTYKLDLKSSVDSMSLYFNTSLTAKDSIPIGKYPLITLPFNLISQLIPYSIIPGYIDDDGTYLYRMGSWYLGTDNDVRLETGFADISRIGNNYNISYEMSTHFGVKISGVYSGPLIYKNRTSSNIKSAKMKGVSKLKSFNKRTIENKNTGRIAQFD